MACDPEQLIEEAKCFQCLDARQQQMVILALLCYIAENGGGGGGGSVAVQQDGVTVVASAVRIDFVDSVAVTNPSTGTAQVQIIRGVHFNAGNPNGQVEATGAAICLDTVNNQIWWKTTVGTSDSQWY